MSNDFIKRCPRCGSKDIGWKSVRLKDCSAKRVFCNTCELTLTNRSIDYLYWRWNRPKEKQAAYIIPLVNKDSNRVAFCGEDLIKIWGNEQKLCEYVSAESNREVIAIPCVANPNGVMLKGL